MAKKRLFDLPQTKGEFQVRGIVSGTRKNSFFTTKKTKNNTNMNLLNFGINFDEGQTAYIALNGMERKEVHFYSAKEKKTIPVAWANRDKPQAEGYKLIGVNVGLETTETDDGKTVNVNKMMTEYDAAAYISTHLTDGMSIFVRGNIVFDSYTDKSGNVKRSTKLIPTQISLCSKPIDFKAEDFKVLADFKTTIVFESIEKEKDDKNQDTGRAVVSALDIGYETVTNTTFVVEDGKLAGQMKKGLREYNSIEVTGKFKSTVQTEQVEETDEWGSATTAYDSVSKPRKFELVVVKAYPATIDREAYTADNIADARKAILNKDKVEEKFGDKKETTDAADEWGSASDDDTPW